MVRKRLPDVLDENELDALLDAPSRLSVLGLRARAVLALMGRCGMRVGEVVALRPKDLHPKAGPPWLRCIGKGDRERRVWLSPSVCALLQLWLSKRPRSRWLFPVVQGGQRTFGKARPGNHISTRAVYNTVQHFAQKAGIERPVHPHTLRHTFATLALRQGENTATVQRALGHARLATTEVYTHIIGGDVAKMMARLDRGKEREAVDVGTLAQGLAELPPEARKALSQLLLE